MSENPLKPWSIATKKTANPTEKELKSFDFIKDLNQNRLKASALMSELLKKSEKGEATIDELLLIAVECIDRMTGDSLTVCKKVLKKNLYEKYHIGDDPF